MLQTCIHVRQARRGCGVRENVLLLGGKWRAIVGIHKRSVACRRSVPLTCVGRLQCNKPLCHVLHYGMDERLGHGRITVACQGRRSETGRTCTPVPTPCTRKTILPALPVRVGVSSSHTTKSLTGGVQNTSRCGMLASVQ